jgi:hypothetical protein
MTGSPTSTIRSSERLKTALDGTRDDDPRRDIGDQMVEMADRGLALYHVNRKVRGAFRGLNWVLPGLSAIASAVGGSVLAADRLPGPARWIVGGASLLGGIAGGLVSVLKPNEELVAHQTWVHLYEDLWRDTWQFAITQLPYVKLDVARAKIDELRGRLAAIPNTTTPAAK